MTIAEQGNPAPSAGAGSAEGATSVWSFHHPGEMRGTSIDELTAALGDESRVTWVDVTDPRPQGLADLTSLLGLADEVARPQRTTAPRPRLEALTDHAHAVILIPTLNDRSLTLSQVDIVITDRYLLFGHDRPLPFRDRVEERAAQHPHLIAQDSAFLLFILLDEWLHEVERITEDLDERIEDMEERAIRDSSNAFLDDAVALKELGFDLYQTVDRHHAVFDAMLNPDFPFVAGELVENHYRDLSRRFERRVAALRNGREAIDNAINIFSSSTAQRTNRIITLLTIISTVLMPMTAIFAFWGTNFVDLPLFTTRMFVVMWATVTVTTVPIIVVLVRTGWLRQT